MGSSAQGRDAFNDQQGTLNGVNAPYLFIRIASDHNNRVCVWQPHVAQMTVVLQQLLVLLMHLLAGHHLGALQQLMCRDTLQCELSYHPQASQPHPGKVEQLRVLFLQHEVTMKTSAVTA